jgi:hypothetical protein
MNIYIANFGSGNWAWPECRRRYAIAVMDDMRVHPYWERGDREGYIQTAMRVLLTKKGKPPTRSVAARWYSVTTLLHETAGDLWIHRERDELWWTVSSDEPPVSEIIDDPDASFGKARIVVYYKRCNPWSQVDKQGRPLFWAGIHPKAREFLFTEGTFQKLSEGNDVYAQALIDGVDLTVWHQLPEWEAKTKKSGRGPVRSFSPEEIAEEQRRRKTAERMAQTALDTAAQSGAVALVERKDKRVRFARKEELMAYARELMESQKGRCALTTVQMLLAGC